MLTVKEVLKLIREGKPGSYADGQGLYLRVTGKDAASWAFRYQLSGTRRVMGLGSTAGMTLADARIKSAEARALVKSGQDPLTVREQEQAEQEAEEAAAITFEQAAGDYIKQRATGWANAKHAAQWASTLATYAYPTIGSKPLAEIRTADVLTILEPMWSAKNETASRVRNRIELVLDAAMARGLMPRAPNPAAWRGHLDKLLAPPSKVAPVEHHAALPYSDMKRFMGALRSITGNGARALELAILTAARSGEVRGATWSEIDLDAALWTIPASRMKARREHRVPLSPAAVALLKAQPRDPRTDLVFPSSKRTMVSDMTLTAAIKRLHEADVAAGGPGFTDPSRDGRVVTAHGFRSAFRDWAAEETHYPNIAAEMALAHTIGNAVEAAYRRGDLLEKRREMMVDWATYCELTEEVAA